MKDCFSLPPAQIRQHPCIGDSHGDRDCGDHAAQGVIEEKEGRSNSK